MNILQKIGHGFAKVGTVIGHVFQSHGEAVQAQIKTLVVSAVEAVSHLDFNGDGKVENAASLIQMAIKDGWTDLQWLAQIGVDLGIPKASVLLAQFMPTSNLQSWIAKASIADQLAKLAGGVTNQQLNYLIEATLAELKTVAANPSTASPLTPADVAAPPAVIVIPPPPINPAPPAPDLSPVPATDNTGTP